MWESLLSRRAMLVRCAILLLPAVGRAQTILSSPSSQIRQLESSTGTRIGVAALDTGNGRTILHRERERFLFCSTWKFLVVAALLKRVDQGEESLQRMIHFHKSDLVPYAPVTKQRLAGGMTLAELCEAAMTVSDNTAANLLLTAVGGFDAINRFVRSLGDQMTVLNRNEPTLNVPNGDEDTTTPLAMMNDMKLILLGGVLKPVSHQKMMDWLAANTTGAAMLRGGLPHDWKVGDKTGRGDQASNDIAIVTPPGRKPILIAAYTMSHRRRGASPTQLEEIGKIVAAAFRT